LGTDFGVATPHYVVPTGVYLWSVRSPEGALCSQWLAKILHGSETVTYNGTTGTVGSFINVHDITSGFYSSYYHYNTSATGTNSLTNVVNSILPSNTGSTSTSW
jgi:iron complex transport system substrate-binding protein